MATQDPVEFGEEFQKRWSTQAVVWSVIFYLGVIVTAVAVANTAYAAWGDNKNTVWWAVIALTLAVMVAGSGARRRGLAYGRAAREVQRALVPFKTQGNPSANAAAAISAGIVAGLNQLDRV